MAPWRLLWRSALPGGSQLRLATAFISQGALSVCLLLLIAALPAWADDDICSTAGWDPQYQKEEINQKCSGARGDDGACVDTRQKLLDWNDLYKGKAEEACGKFNEIWSNLGELSQSGSQSEIVEKAQNGGNAIDNLLRANEEILKKIPKLSVHNTGAIVHILGNRHEFSAAHAVAQQINTDFNNAQLRPSILRTKGIRGRQISGITDASVRQQVKAQTETLGKSQEFVEFLLKDKEKLQNAKTQLEIQKQKALTAKDDTRTAGNDDDHTGSGFHAMDLLPLAAPLAGLLMQQKNNSDSGITDPSLNPAGPTAPPVVEGTPFTGPDGSSSSTPGTASVGTGQQPNGPDHGIGSPVDTAPPAFSDSVDSGNISQGSGDGAGQGSGGFFPSSGSSGLLGSSSSGAGGQGEEEARKPAAAKAEDTGGDDGLMMSGGGGGLTFNGAGAGDSFAGDEGMQDVLQDIEATLEDSPTGIFAEAEEQANEAELESPDSLFPRVRACYVRNLKKGNVLNGLGEKLSEGESE